MLYLNKNAIADIELSWGRAIDCIQNVVGILADGDYSQPLKPYLRYGNLVNRIIAMPAYVGGVTPSAGIKWIASFPDNIEKNLPRANSVTIINDTVTGIPTCIINTSAISEIRTAAVSGLLVREYISSRKLSHYKIGIIGFGPIGQRHMHMLRELLEGQSFTFYVYDIKNSKIDKSVLDQYPDIRVVSSWQEAYDEMHVFLSCTVSKERYIDRKPQKGALLLNVSLRDFKPDIIDFVDEVVVDDWDEVCRQNTDIEVMHNQKNLQKEQTSSLIEMAKNRFFEKIQDSDVVMFNPMGMAVFDIALGNDYYQAAVNQNIGIQLAD